MLRNKEESKSNIQFQTKDKKRQDLINPGTTNKVRRVYIIDKGSKK